jgi:hypothetical protein
MRGRRAPGVTWRGLPPHISCRLSPPHAFNFRPIHRLALPSPASRGTTVDDRSPYRISAASGDMAVGWERDGSEGDRAGCIADLTG